MDGRPTVRYTLLRILTRQREQLHREPQCHSASVTLTAGLISSNVQLILLKSFLGAAMGDLKSRQNINTFPCEISALNHRALERSKAKRHACTTQRLKILKTYYNYNIINIILTFIWGC